MRSVRLQVGRFINRLIDRLTNKPEPPYVFEGVKVGDRFKSTKPYEYALEGVRTVTQLTEKGFKYSVEKPHNVYPARYGPSLTQGGEMYINSVDHPEAIWNSMYEKL